MLTEHDCKIAPSTYYAQHKRLRAPACRRTRERAEPRTDERAERETEVRLSGGSILAQLLARRDEGVGAVGIVDMPVGVHRDGRCPALRGDQPREYLFRERGVSRALVLPVGPPPATRNCGYDLVGPLQVGEVLVVRDGTHGASLRVDDKRRSSCRVPCLHPNHAADLGLGAIEDRGPAGLIEVTKVHRPILSHGDERRGRLLALHVHPFTPLHIAKYADTAARTVRDAELKPLIQQIFEVNYRVYGARKVWRELHRQGYLVARCTVERLMRELGVAGAVRGEKIITTIPDGSVERAPDLLDRKFVAPALNRCWVADFTHVSTWSGVVYVAFVVDTFSRRIVGWSAVLSKETRLVLDALDMALWQRDRDEQPYQRGELIHHSDAGSQYTSFRLAEHLDAAGIAARSAPSATPTTTPS